MNCIFCKIINKEIPSYIVYEDEIVIVGAKEKYEPRCRLCHEVPHKLDK